MGASVSIAQSVKEHDIRRETRRLFSEARDKTPLPAWMDSKKGGARLIKLIRDTPGCEKFVQDIDEVATETGLGLFDAGLSSANGLEQQHELYVVMNFPPKTVMISSFELSDLGTSIRNPCVNFFFVTVVRFLVAEKNISVEEAFKVLEAANIVDHFPFKYDSNAFSRIKAQSGIYTNPQPEGLSASQFERS